MTAVILDTDIGTDIDDTWALALLLGCPELDLRLVVTATGDTTYRARLAAGILAAGGRCDVPVGIGIPTTIRASAFSSVSEELRPQAGFADEIDLDRYAGGVHRDGVQALVDFIMESPEPVTVIAIGPTTNLAGALEREPQIAGKSRVVAMLGSVRTGYMSTAGPVAEYNVAVDVPACRAVFDAAWDVTITPLDTCGSVVLRDARYHVLRDAETRLMKAVLRNYVEWATAEGPRLQGVSDASEVDIAHSRLVDHSTTVLFDTVAVYMAYDEAFLNIERLPIALGDDGTMSVSARAPELRVATSWRDAEAFADHLAARLTHAGRR